LWRKKREKRKVWRQFAGRQNTDAEKVSVSNARNGMPKGWEEKKVSCQEEMGGKDGWKKMACVSGQGNL